MKTLILLTMIFLHIVDDFYLQGVLAQMKQKKWWQKQTKDSRYKWDYLAALIIHGLSWSFMVHLPFAWMMAILGKFQYATEYTVSLLIHAGVHALIDHAKANAHVINLCEDQAFHADQILIIWATMIMAIYR